MQSEELDTPDSPAVAPVQPVLHEAVMYQRSQDSGYSLRRMVYVFGTTVFLLSADAAFVGFGYTGDLVTKFVDGSFSLMSAIALYYLGAGVLDRSEFLRRMGDSFRRRDDGDGDVRRDGDCPPKT